MGKITHVNEQMRLLKRALVQRYWEALKHLQAQEGQNVPDLEIGKRVGQITHRKVHKGIARSWRVGAIPRKDPWFTMATIAGVLGVTPGWLYFGEGKPPWSDEEDATPSAGLRPAPVKPFDGEAAATARRAEKAPPVKRQSTLGRTRRARP